MKEKKIIRYIFDKVYRHEVMFVTGCSLKVAAKELKKYGIEFEYPKVEAAGLMQAFDSRNYPKMESGIALFLWVHKRGDLYSLSHEISHLCVQIFELSNMEVNSHTQEAFAFYYEHWFKILWEIMCEK